MWPSRSDARDLGLPVSLAWDANPESTVIGYVVYVGTSPGQYSQSFDVGNNTTYTFSGGTRRPVVLLRRGRVRLGACAGAAVERGLDGRPAHPSGGSGGGSSGGGTSGGGTSGGGTSGGGTSGGGTSGGGPRRWNQRRWNQRRWNQRRRIWSAAARPVGPGGGGSTGSGRRWRRWCLDWRWRRRGVVAEPVNRSVSSPTSNNAPAGPGVVLQPAVVSGTSLTLQWAAVGGLPVLEYIIEAGSGPGLSNIYNGSVGMANLVSATVGARHLLRPRSARALNRRRPSRRTRSAFPPASRASRHARRLRRRRPA